MQDSRRVSRIPRTALPQHLADRWTAPAPDAFRVGRNRVTVEEAHAWRGDAQSRLAELDAAIDELAEQRREVAAELAALDRLCWPYVKPGGGRRPPAVDEEPMPAIADEPVWLWGRDLRAAVLALLRRRGELSLREIQADLRLRGMAIVGHQPHKTLADALGYEARRGRVVRVCRGHYAPNPHHPSAGRPLRRRRRVCDLPGYGETPVRHWPSRRRWWREDVQLLSHLAELGPWPPDANRAYTDSHAGVIDPRLRASPWWRHRCADPRDPPD